MIAVRGNNDKGAWSEQACRASADKFEAVARAHQELVQAEFMVGLSYERTFKSEENGLPLGDSGGSGVFIHPGIVFDITPTVQMFGLVSLPLSQGWNSPVDQQRFRLGTGIIWILKHSGA